MKQQSFFLLILSFSLLLFACPKQEETDDDLQSKAQINPAFEQTPPIANDIEFEVLEEPKANGDNVRFVATFDQGQIDGQFHAVLLGDEKVVMRDDGKGADTEAGDGKFSIFLKEDLDAFEAEVNRSKEFAFADSNFVFENRSAQPLKTDLIEGFVFDKKVKGKLTKLPLNFGIAVFGFPINADEVLVIRDVDVVEDPARTFNPCTGAGNARGVWTFGELMRQLASPNSASIASDADASAFVLNFLQSWESAQTINGENVPARTGIRGLIIDPWLIASQAAGAPPGELKMELAPFRLLSIVNRMDLSGNSGYGFSNAGEGRFVFSAIGPGCSVEQFTVIFEYGINKRSCSAIKSYLQEWLDLDAMTLGSAAYNQALEDITLQFSQSGTNTSKPNHSSLNQIRTNEIAIGSPWELREFNLMAASSQLETVTVTKEPAVKYNAKVNNLDVQRLVHFINTNTSAVEANTISVPLTQPVNPGSTTPTTGFQGGKSHTPFGTFWDGESTAGPTFITSDKARHVFSLNTCSGCHGGETATTFTHIKPAPFGVEAPLSGFMTGVSVSDPANRPLAGTPAVRGFNDISRRKGKLNSMRRRLCIRIPIFELAHKLTLNPLRMTH